MRVRKGQYCRRQAALSMAWANFRHLGCRYPATVEERAGIKGPMAASGNVETAARR